MKNSSEKRESVYVGTDFIYPQKKIKSPVELRFRLNDLGLSFVDRVTFGDKNYLTVEEGGVRIDIYPMFAAVNRREQMTDEGRWLIRTLRKIFDKDCVCSECWRYWAENSSKLFWSDEDFSLLKDWSSPAHTH